MILKNKADLPKGVYVEEDFPFEIQERRNILRPIVKLARNHRNYRRKVTLQYDKVVLDNKEYGVNDLSQLPSEISPILTYQKSNGTIVGFLVSKVPSQTCTVVLLYEME